MFANEFQLTIKGLKVLASRNAFKNERHKLYVVGNKVYCWIFLAYNSNLRLLL